METRAHYVAVGAFVLTMIVLAFATVLWLGRAELSTQYANYDIYFVGPDSGLRVGATVEYTGVAVGKGSEIKTDPPNAEQMRRTNGRDPRGAIKAEDIAELAVNANTAVLTAGTLLGNVDKSYSGPDGLGNKATGAITDFDRVAKDLILALQDARPGVRTFSQQTLSDVGALVGEARQLISGLNRLTAEIERDPSRVLFG